MNKTIFITLIMSMLGCNTNKGKEIPPFNFVTLEGKTITKDSLKGEVTILCVWATWCGDCIREIPELNDLVTKYKENNKVNFIALSDENEETVRKSLLRFPFYFDHVVNAGEYTNLIKTGLTKHFPQVLFVDKDLNIIFDVTENKEHIFGVLDNYIQQNLD
jgi:thiol-disulfide isomerase/thioredoxin